MRTTVIVIERAGDDYSAYAPELPGRVATGSTEKEADANMRDALELHLRGMAEDGEAAGERDVVVRRVRVALVPAVGPADHRAQRPLLHPQAKRRLVQATVGKARTTASRPSGRPAAHQD